MELVSPTVTASTNAPSQYQTAGPTHQSYNGPCCPLLGATTTPAPLNTFGSGVDTNTSVTSWDMLVALWRIRAELT